MKIHLVILFTALASFGIAQKSDLTGNLNAGSTWVSTNGPYGANINCLATLGSKIFAGTDEGLYFSVDLGATWHVLEDCPFSTAAVFSYKKKIYKKACGLKVSSDSGNTWITLNTDAIFPADNDGGNSVPGFGAIGDTLFYCNEGGIYKCGINDSIFTLVKSGPFQSFAAHNYSLIGSTWDEGDVITYLSNDGGNSWIGINSIGGSAIEFKGDSIFLGNFISPDLGITWFLNSQLPSTNFLFTPDTLFAGTMNGVYYSINDGAEWNPLGVGLERKYVTSMVLCEGNLFAGTDYFNGMYKFNNGQWQECNTNLSGAPCYSLQNTDTGLFVSIDQKLYRLNEEDSSWEKTQSDISELFAYSDSGNPYSYFYPGYIDHIETLNGNIYALDDNGHLFVLIKGNKNWELIYSDSIGMKGFLKYNNRLLLNTTFGLYEIQNKSFSYIGGVNYNQYVADGNVIYSHLFNEIYRSDDNGLSFFKITDTNNLDVKNIQSIAVKGNLICVGTFNEGLFISKDGGSSWTKAWDDTSGSYFKNFVRNILIIDSIILISVNFNGKILFSNDQGTSWNFFNDGLAFNPSQDLIGTRINQIVVHGNNLYAALNRKGVFARSINNPSTTVNNEEEILPVIFKVFPNPFVSYTTIKLASVFDNNSIKLKIFDLSGKEINTVRYESNDSEIKIYRENLTSGLYIYKVIDKNETIQSGKIIVE